MSSAPGANGDCAAFGNEPNLDGLDPRFTVRPVPRVFRTDKPSWEVLFDGAAIGRIKETRIGRTSTPFYAATGYFPGTGEHVSLELSATFTERCQVLLDFQRSPQSSVHLPRHLRAK